MRPRAGGDRLQSRLLPPQQQQQQHITATLEEYRTARNRVIFAFVVAGAVLMVGALGYWYLGSFHRPGLWSLRDCVYMTAITVTTVGFGEIIEVAEVPGGREWTMLLLLFGVCANLYVVSSITSFFVEGDFNQIRRYRRHQRMMKEIKDHYVVCGCGSTGSHVVSELLAIGERVVVIDLHEEALAHFEDKVVPVVGDATDDEVLERAGVRRAKGVIATLDDDKTNMFVVVSARQSAPKARIVAKAVLPSAVGKLKRAGADAVVSPNMIGGMRMASEMVRPHVVRFIDEMLRDRKVGLRIEEATVGERGKLVGATLRGADLRSRTGALILAVRLPSGDVEHAPGPDFRFAAGQTLIAIGTVEQIQALRALGG